MATPTSLASVRGIQTEDVERSLTTAEQQAELLRAALPVLIDEACHYIGRPFRILFDPTTETASTDCFAEVRISPNFFLTGHDTVGYATGNHEAGHVRFSPWGAKLMKQAHHEGGEVLKSIANIIMDRRDDRLNVQFAPGFADRLRRRLLYICTMTLREEHADLLKKLTEDEQQRFLRNYRSRDPYRDFFFACKWGKHPRLRSVAKAMRVVKRANLPEAGAEKILATAKRVREILGEPQRQSGKRFSDFELLVAFANAVAAGRIGPDGKAWQISPELKSEIDTIIAQFVATTRQAGLSQLLQQLAGQMAMHPGPISVGHASTIERKRVEHNGSYETAYRALLANCDHLVEPLIRRLRMIDNPSTYTISGLDDGDEIDFTQVARIACGLGGFWKEEVTERDIDAEIHLAIDHSGSMRNGKVRIAKRIAALFSEAILTMHPAVDGAVWGFNSDAVTEFGPVSRTSGFVELEGSGGNSDSDMLQIVGEKLALSQHRRRILLVLCDDGPDSIEDVQKITGQLMGRGILVIHLLVGVHATPHIYPIELVYTTIEECLEELPDLLYTIISKLR